MTVEEQIRMNELSQECERLHKELQTKEKYINYLREDKKTLYTRCDETARDAFKMGAYGRIRITGKFDILQCLRECSDDAKIILTTTHGDICTIQANKIDEFIDMMKGE